MLNYFQAGIRIIIRKTYCKIFRHKASWPHDPNIEWGICSRCWAPLYPLDWLFSTAKVQAKMEGFKNDIFMSTPLWEWLSKKEELK